MKLHGTKLITNNQSTASTGKRLISLFKTHVFALKFYAEKNNVLDPSIPEIIV